MSGGHWDYDQHKMESFIERFSDDSWVVQRFPKLGQIFGALGVELGRIAHDIDWAFSGDTSIDDDIEFEAEAIKRLGAVFGKDLKVKIYEISQNMNEVDDE